MMQCISSMTDHDAVNSFCDLVAYGPGKQLVLVGAHVLAEYGKELLRAYIAYIGQLGHGTVQLTGRKRRNYCTGAVIKPRGNGSPRTKQFDIGFVIRIGKFLLGDLIIGLVVTGLRHADYGGNINADIIP